MQHHTAAICCPGFAGRCRLTAPQAPQTTVRRMLRVARFKTDGDGTYDVGTECVAPACPWRPLPPDLSVRIHCMQLHL